MRKVIPADAETSEARPKLAADCILSYQSVTWQSRIGFFRTRLLFTWHIETADCAGFLRFLKSSWEPTISGQTGSVEAYGLVPDRREPRTSACLSRRPPVPGRRPHVRALVD